jgi:hypothetical protein
MDDPNLGDDSWSSHVTTLNGNVARSATQSKFGGYSMHVADASSDYLTIADSTDFTFGTGDFTIDTWYYFVTSPVSTGDDCYVMNMGSRNGTNNVTALAVTNIASNDRFQFWADVGGTVNAVVLNGTTNLSTNTWYHVAVIRNGNTFSLYVNGSLET